MEETEGMEKERKERLKKLKLYKYIGETSRSVYERGWEHLNDLQTLKSDSHMLKHIIDKHSDVLDHSEIKFGIRVIQHTRSSFERQVLESVKIQQEREGHYILNSRSEFNRCAVPRLTTKLGETDYRKYEQEMEKEKEQEKLVCEKIIQMKKTRNKDRKNQQRKKEPSGKRRKLDCETFIEVIPERGRPDTKEIGEKRMNTEKIDHKCEPERKRMKQWTIKEMLNERKIGQKLG